jgi:hypothetical protein
VAAPIAFDTETKAPAISDRGHGVRGTPLYLSCLMLAGLYVGKQLVLTTPIDASFQNEIDSQNIRPIVIDKGLYKRHRKRPWWLASVCKTSTEQ